MQYIINEFARLVGVTAHTIRYYEKEGLLKPKRLNNGHRIYSQHDVEWIQFILRLKETKMPLKIIQRYAVLRAQGDGTVQERKALLEEHQIYLDKTIKEWQEHQQKLNQKIQFYHAMCEQNCCSSK